MIAPRLPPPTGSKPLSDIDVLAVAALPPFLMGPLRAAYRVHDRVHATDAAAFADVAPKVRAIAASGESRVDAALIAQLPALEIISVQVDGLMLGWTLGGYPSPNLEAVGEVLAGGTLERVAQRRFGAELAPAALAAWEFCSAAFQEFPYHIGVVYSGPQQCGPSNLLWEKPTSYHATMVGFPYDDLAAWRSIYPAPVFIERMLRVADGFAKGAIVLREAAARATKETPAVQRSALQSEADVMAAAGIHWQSVANQARFVVARDALTKATSAAAREPLLNELESLLRAEIVLARELHALQSRDSRLGFEASNQYFYVPVDLAEKVLNCRELLDRWIPEMRNAKL